MFDFITYFKSKKKKVKKKFAYLPTLFYFFLVVIVLRGSSGRGGAPCLWTHDHIYAHNSQSSHRVGRSRPWPTKRSRAQHQKKTTFDLTNSAESELSLLKPRGKKKLFTAYCLINYRNKQKCV